MRHESASAASDACGPVSYDRSPVGPEWRAASLSCPVVQCECRPLRGRQHLGDSGWQNSVRIELGHIQVLSFFAQTLQICPNIVEWCRFRELAHREMELSNPEESFKVSGDIKQEDDQKSLMNGAPKDSPRTRGLANEINNSNRNSNSNSNSDKIETAIRRGRLLPEPEVLNRSFSCPHAHRACI